MLYHNMPEIYFADAPFDLQSEPWPTWDFEAHLSLTSDRVPRTDRRLQAAADWAANALVLWLIHHEFHDSSLVTLQIKAPHWSAHVRWTIWATTAKFVGFMGLQIKNYYRMPSAQIASIHRLAAQVILVDLEAWSMVTTINIHHFVGPLTIINHHHPNHRPNHHPKPPRWPPSTTSSHSQPQLDRLPSCSLPPRKFRASGDATTRAITMKLQALSISNDQETVLLNTFGGFSSHRASKGYPQIIQSLIVFE